MPHESSISKVCGYHEPSVAHQRGEVCRGGLCEDCLNTVEVARVACNCPSRIHNTREDVELQLELCNLLDKTLKKRYTLAFALAGVAAASNKISYLVSWVNLKDTMIVLFQMHVWLQIIYIHVYIYSAKVCGIDTNHVLGFCLYSSHSTF